MKFFNYTQTNKNVLQKIYRGKDKTKLSINGGNPIDLFYEDWRDNADAKMSYFSMQLMDDNSVYLFSNPDGLIVMGFGTGPNPVQGIITSYYYLAYSAMRDLEATFFANNISYQILKENPFCENLINFRAEIDGKGIEIDTVKWFIKGIEEVDERNKLVWHKTFSPGEYEIKMWVHFENGDTLSKTGTLVRKNCNQGSAFYANDVLHTALKDTTFCNKNVSFHAELEDFVLGRDHVKWYIDDGTGYVIAAQDQLNWNRQFATGNYEIKMEVLYLNGNPKILTGTLKMNVLWIKIKNVRY